MTENPRNRLTVINDTGSWSASYDGYGTSSYQGIAIDGGSVIALALAHSPNIFAEVDPSDRARRLVACWNACEGISTEHLENIDMLGEKLAGRFEALHASERELMDTRDELLQALIDIAEESTDPGAVECAREAIAKADARSA